MKKALLLINKKSRMGEEVGQDIEALLEKQGIECIVPDSDKASFSGLIAEYAASVDMVVIGGGDGTLNHAAEALVESKATLGIIPLGTANDLCRTLGIPDDLHEAVAVLGSGQPRKINIGKVNDRYFFNVANLGIGVDVNRALSSKLKKSWGSLSYFIAALEVVWRHKPFRVTIRAGQRILKAHTVQLAVGNGCFYGGGMRVHEEASIYDDELCVYLIKQSYLLRLFLHSKKFIDGKFDNIQGVKQLKGNEISIETRRPKSIMADGENIAHSPAIFSQLKNAIDVIVPAEEAKANG